MELDGENDKPGGGDYSGIITKFVNATSKTCNEPQNGIVRAYYEEFICKVK